MKIFRSPLFYLILFSITLIGLFSNTQKYSPIFFKDELPSTKTEQLIFRVNWLPSPTKFTEDGEVNLNQEIIFNDLKVSDIFIDTIKYHNSSDLFIGGEHLDIHDNFSYAHFNSLTAHEREELIPPSYENRTNLVFADTTGWKPDYYHYGRTIDFKDIDIHSISGDCMTFRGDHAFRFNLDKVNLRLFQVIGIQLGKEPATFEFNDLTFPETNKNLTTSEKKDTIKQVTIFNQSVGAIRSDNVKVLHLDSCIWADTAIIICGTAEIFVFNNVKCKSANSVITLGNAKPGSTLLLRKTDMSRVDFDYSRFQFSPYMASAYINENEWYSDVVSIYKGIIASQTRLNNIDGIKASTISLAIFEDNHTWYARPFIGVKIWWNNYGFDKGKVITSSLILFTLFLAVNLLFMGAFTEHYDVASIKREWTATYSMTGKIIKYGRRFVLAILYTGVIFYGIKLDFSKLETKRLDVVICLFVEYIAGLIAITYIAGLIINK